MAKQYTRSNARTAEHVVVVALRPLAGPSLASVVFVSRSADRKIHPGELRALKLIRLIMTTLPGQKLPAVFPTS
jgi:hypothetical protein